MKTRTTEHLIYTATATVLLAAFAPAQTVLFGDSFTRSNNTDLNASDAGQSGAFSPLDWVEVGCDGGGAEINGNQLRFTSTGSGNSGAVVYPDQNFIGLTALTATMEIASGTSSGDGRATGLGIGYSKSTLDAKTSASQTTSGASAGADIYLGYDNVGSTRSVYIREGSTQVFSKAIPLTAYPAKYSIVATFADMNDGTTITYEVFENDALIHTDSTTWTGTNQNYIAFSSNYTGNNADINFVQIVGTLAPPPVIVKADNADDLNLGTSWVGGAAPAAGEIATWDNTVTAANSTVLGAAQTWGGIGIVDPVGLVTIHSANTLTLDSVGTAIDLSAATTDLTLDCGLVMTGAGTWNVAAGRTLSAGGVISGSSGLTKLGEGTAILSGANSYSGATSVTAGTLQLGASEVIPHGGGGGASGAITVNGTLDLNGFSETLNGLSGAGVIDTVAGGSPTLEVGHNGASGTFNGILQNTSGTLNLTKFGVGILTLGGANSYSGATTVLNGTLQVTNASALGNTSGISLAGGTTFAPDLDGLVITAGITLGATGTSSFISVPIDGGTMTVNGEISGDGDLVFTDLDDFGSNTNGIILLGAANTYTGDTVIGTGALLGNNTIIRSGIADALPVTTVLSLEGLAGQGSGRSVTFDLNGNDQTLAGLRNVPQFDRQQRVTTSGAATLTVDNADDFTFGAGGGDDGFARIQGAISLVKAGAGTFTLVESQTYTGATTVNAGTLGLNGASLTSAVTVAAGASLEFTLGAPATTTGSLDLGTGTVKIIGTVDNASDYPLITATAGITGSLTPDVPIPGYQLELRESDTELWLASIAPAGYSAWASLNGAGPNLEDDHDGDGVTNGVEFFIGGPTGNTTGFTVLPGVVDDAGTLSVTFTMAADYPGAYGTDFVVETSATLANPWTAETAAPDPGFTVTFPSATEVKYTFPPGTGNFARLKVTGP